jgi:hypothetical protein
MFAKWTEVNGIKCQGKTEARMCQLLIDEGLPVNRGKAVKTTLGNYTPDFDCGEFYVEVKAINSWLQSHGMAPFMENARSEKMSRLSDTQHRKMLEVNKIKPVIVLVDMTHSKKAYREMPLPETDLKVIIGMPDIIKEQLHDTLESNPSLTFNAAASGC